ncbi:hypothetical protein SCUCBS95973_005666 [Sporothrix curviconia]|uniref:Uncharacterized protein n=1 Tax=Sporothrix curviconia TaxID=1260050 RepID=A0ABP0C0T3_9PEZI
MARWTIPSLPSTMWSSFASPSARDRVSHSYYSIKSPRPYYSTATPAPYRIQSRVSIRDKTGTSLKSTTYARPSYPSYHTSGSGYSGACGTYDSYGASLPRSYIPSSRDTYYRSTSYCTPVRDVYDDFHNYSRHRPSVGRHAGSGSSSKRHSTSSTNNQHTAKKVHWDETTFRGYHLCTDHGGERRRHHRHRSDSEHDYDAAYDRHGRATTSSNNYYYTEALSDRNRDYYYDETDRRSRKSHGYWAAY